MALASWWTLFIVRVEGAIPVEKCVLSVVSSHQLLSRHPTIEYTDRHRTSAAPEPPDNNLCAALLFHEGLGAFRQLVGRHIFHVRGEGPVMPEAVFQAT
jgi:hypothetical protein